MMIKRNVTLPERKSFFLFGPRLSGKSTLLKANYASGKGLHYFDLLDTSALMRYIDDPATFYREIKASQEDIHIIIVDEIQRAPMLLNEIHRLIVSFAPDLGVYFYHIPMRQWSFLIHR
ncbi:MAG TPA: AAA family ATPase [Candidatus Deferrimicrobium sp.]|nr:AAA family ATPase [Candidatus Deferrimicrobium sp.]